MPTEPASSPRSAPSFHTDAIPFDRSQSAGDGVPADDPMAMLVGILDLQAALPSIQRIRRWGHDALAVEPGERALDIGAGTGSEVMEFADRVGPDGDAVGVDPNPAMLDVARARAEAAGSRARFIEGTAYHLPFPDASFDVVRCERVYQHLDDPAAATAEIARVLRPGGRVLLIDSDWHTAITHPGDPDVLGRLSTVMLAATPNPTSGRRLRGLLTAAGFAIDDMGSEAVIWDPETIRPLFAQMVDGALAEGVITGQERLDLDTAMESGIARGDYHLSVTMFAVLAHQPE
ncbi:methyltransferase domain-containing protein [Nocardia sp. NBC_00508]|uniref:methyltransferase domain-containing protein n=1 Tax=Nocardia sp. NBC_00508 TaxID=2975992 RepID=UPI002E806797|nr:methyltransferase domain-containing protein [Nocardia sp. NBC_00508]WUD67844.1 methyltransferase domain-containing protein [Nocardia sp. NBC_00508]